MRTPLDQYPTPPFQTMALLKRVPIRGRICEPCAGEGAIVKVFREVVNPDSRLITNDIDTVFGCDHNLDATKPELWNTLDALHGRFDWFVTNPPFNAAIDILEHAHRHAIVGVAFLLRLSFLEPTRDFKRKGVQLKGREDFIVKNPPDKIIVLPRYKYKKGSKSTDSCTTAWMIWLNELHGIGKPIPRSPIEIVPKSECI